MCQTSENFVRWTPFICIFLTQNTFHVSRWRKTRISSNLSLISSTIVSVQNFCKRLLLPTTFTPKSEYRKLSLFLDVHSTLTNTYFWLYIFFSWKSFFYERKSHAIALNIIVPTKLVRSNLMENQLKYQTKFSMKTFKVHFDWFSGNVVMLWPPINWAPVTIEIIESNLKCDYLNVQPTARARTSFLMNDMWNAISFSKINCDEIECHKSIHNW